MEGLYLSDVYEKLLRCQELRLLFALDLDGNFFLVPFSNIIKSVVLRFTFTVCIYLVKIDILTFQDLGGNFF